MAVLATAASPTLRACRALSEPAGLSGEDLETWSALATLVEWLRAALDAQLQRDAGLTHFEYGVLFALRDAPEHTLRMSTLAGYSNSSLSRLSRAVARLEAQGVGAPRSRPERRALHAGDPDRPRGRRSTRPLPGTSSWSSASSSGP